MTAGPKEGVTGRNHPKKDKSFELNKAILRVHDFFAESHAGKKEVKFSVNQVNFLPLIKI